MPRKPSARKPPRSAAPARAARAARPSSLVDTRIIYCGDCLDQIRKLPDGCVDLIYVDRKRPRRVQARMVSAF